MRGGDNAIHPPPLPFPVRSAPPGGGGNGREGSDPPEAPPPSPPPRPDLGPFNPFGVGAGGGEGVSPRGPERRPNGAVGHQKRAAP